MRSWITKGLTLTHAKMATLTEMKGDRDLCTCVTSEHPPDTDRMWGGWVNSTSKKVLGVRGQEASYESLVACGSQQSCCHCHFFEMRYQE